MPAARVLEAVMAIHLVDEFAVRAGRPVVLVEAWRVFQLLLRHIHDEALVFLVEGQRFHGDGEVLVANAKEPTEGEHRIADVAVLEIEHEVFDAAKIFLFAVDDLVVGEGVCRE